MATETNFNTPPYNDDFSEEKNFHRVLFRPATAVQARELTQLQTIHQNQIERFGNHIFKDGSVVEGIAISYHPNVHYISVEDNFNTNTDLVCTDITPDYLITNSTNSNNAVRAVVRIGKNGIKTNPPETNRFYLSYLVTGTDVDGNDVNAFLPGDTLYIYANTQNKFANLDANNLVDSIQTLPSNSTFTSNGNAYVVKVTDGIVFQKGFFTRVDAQEITVRDFSTNVTGYVVGFNTVENIVDENEDQSLFDNALGYPNENAPGAHRLKLTPTLTAKLKTDTANDTNFFAIAEFDDQLPTEQKDDPVYAKLQETISKRTYEESGDYVVEPFRVESRVSSNSQTFYYEITPGVAYVRGNRIDKIGPTKIETIRAIETEYAVDQVVTANYGNYVICDEFLGMPDFSSFEEVAIYDQAQNGISDIEGEGTAPSGSIVGYCNIRAVDFKSGTKGTAAADYYTHIFNVRMNSGKSFSADAKSFVGTFFKADLVLENSAAVIKENTRNSLLFNNGLSATKSLTNNTGLGDTSYVYSQYQTSAGTLANTTGLVTVTISPAGAGGNEKLNATSGSVLSGASLNDYNIIVTSNAYTTNLAGTVEIQSGNTYIGGTSTTFTTDFQVGALIRIHANSTQTYVRRVTEITNSTLMAVDAPLAQSNTTSNYQKMWLDGTALPVANITILSNTSFTANLGYSLDTASQTVSANFPIYRSSAQKIPKNVRKNRFVTINCASAGVTGPWNLGFSDIHKIRNVYVGTTYANTNPERSSWFNLDTGQTPSYYDHGKLVIKPQYASQISAATRMVVEFDYFYANTVASVGYFSVESYPIDDANTANTDAIQSIEFPQYDGKDLRNFIDFRPRKANTAADATTIGTATENPAVANSNTFNVGSGAYLIGADLNFIADFEYYVPRIDHITLNSVGAFNVNRGKPGINPRAPFLEGDQCLIAEAYVPAYPSPTTREVENYPGVQAIKTNIKTNRRYTMRDIGVLDERLKRIEYYTVLSALEQQAHDTTITDATGLDRFKNGIFADPFNSHKIGNVADFEYKIAIDQDRTVARPLFRKHDVDTRFVPNTSSDSVKSTGVQQTGQLITLPYTSETYINQRYATNIRVVTESFWQWNAEAVLYPSYDIHRDEERAPNYNVDIDLSSPWKDFANSPFGTRYGEWRTTDVSSSTGVVTDTTGNTQTGGTTTTTTTVTTTTTKRRTVDQLNIDTFTTKHNLGTFVTDVSIQPYIREQTIAFIVTGIKPNTTLHCFFDDVNVDAHCAPGELSGISPTVAYQGQPPAVVNQTGNFGDPIVSDAQGNVQGKFRIPAGQFRTGDRVFEITNVSDLIVGADAKITAARARFTADNLSVTKGSTTLNLTQPKIGFTSSVQNSTSTSTNTTVVVVPFPPTPIPKPIGDGGDGDSGFPVDTGDGDGGDGGDGDPLTQSFYVTNIPSDVSGVFVTQVGLFFQAKDSTLGCGLLITEVKDGYPDATRVIGTGYMESANVVTSSTAASETIFVLEEPTYLLSNKEYAFIIYPDANSPEYVAWVGKTGGRDIATDEQVFSNPYSGTMFVSANKRTWTAIQKEDVKFKIYRARFTEAAGTAIFKNDDDEFITIDGFTKANSANDVRIGDVVYTVNSVANTANTANLISFVLSGASDPKGFVQYYNTANGALWLDSSNGGFSNTTNPTLAIFRPSDPTNTALLNANSFIASAVVQTVDNLTYHAVVPKFGTLQPSKTSITVDFKGTSTTNTVDTQYTAVVNETELEFADYERHLMSKSNEVATLSGAKSALFKLNLVSYSDFVSPVVSLGRKASFFIENMINNDTTDEHTRYGNALAKYVSKKISLADGQEAEDLQVFITAVKPFDTDIKVYCKQWNAEDPETFETKVWSEMSYLDGGELVYSSPTDKEDFIEFKFGMPAANLVATGAFANVDSGTYGSLTGTVSIANNSSTVTGTGTLFNTELSVGDRIRIVSSNSTVDYFAVRTVTDIANSTQLTLDKGVEQTNTASVYYVYNDAGNYGINEYVNSAGSRFIGFKQFAIKIVLLSSNPVRVPILQDVRAIALQV